MAASDILPGQCSQYCRLDELKENFTAWHYDTSVGLLGKAEADRKHEQGVYGEFAVTQILLTARLKGCLDFICNGPQPDTVIARIIKDGLDDEQVITSNCPISNAIYGTEEKIYYKL